MEGNHTNNQDTKWLSKLVFILDKINLPNKWFNTIGMVSIFLMACLTFIDVFLRYLFHRPISGTTEFIELLLVIGVFLAIGYTQVMKGHVAIDLVVNRLSAKAQVIIRNVTDILSLGLFCCITWRSIVYMLWIKAGGLSTPVVEVPIFYFAWIVPFGCTLLCLVLLRDLLNNLIEGVRLRLGISLWLLAFGIPVLVATVAAILILTPLWEISLPMTGVIFMGLLLLFLFLGMPVGFTLAMVALLGMAYVRGPEAGFTVIGTELYRNTAQYSWAVLPLFMLMGFFCFFAAMSKDLYLTAYKWLGHLPGGIAMATVGACTVFGAVVGDNLTGTVTMGTISLPEMKRYKYDTRLAVGCVCSGGTIGTLIPPSIGFILYGVLAEQSIGQLFIAGIFPGLLCAALFMVYIYLSCRLNPKLGPRGEITGFREKLISLKLTWPILVLFMLVIGGIYGGLFTPGEGGAIGACGALIVALSMRRMSWERFIATLLETGRMTAMCFIILGGAMMFGYVLAATRLPIEVADFVTGFNLPPLGTLIAILSVLVILGCVMPAIPMIIITVPIFFPTVMTLGYDPIWFGVIMVLMLNIASITPPYGINIFALKGVAKDVSIGTMFRGVIPFVLCGLLCVAIIIAFPQIATWLPYALRG